MKRLFCMLLTSALILELCGGLSVCAARDSALPDAQWRLEATLRYMDAFCLDHSPPQYGTPRDHQTLQTLSDAITGGLTDDRAKADAIHGWVARNIVCDETASPYPADTFFRRRGNRLGLALLTRELLRLQDIPAVVCDGYRGDLSGSEYISLKTWRDHAWCYAHVDGQWVMYDPLWEDSGITDRAYLAQWYFHDSVEFVTPVYDAGLFRSVRGKDREFVYMDGRFYNTYGDLTPSDLGTGLKSVCGLTLRCTGSTKLGDSTDGISYEEESRNLAAMDYGEAYRGGWLLRGGELCFYAWENGILADQVLLEREDGTYYCHGDGISRVVMDEADFYLSDGCFVLRPGYTGAFLTPARAGGSFRWESDAPDIASVDQSGVITARKPGSATVRVSQDGDTVCLYRIRVSQESRIPDYSDHSPVSFTDVAENAFYSEAVDWAVRKGITRGITESAFSPDGVCTRAQVVTFLWRASGCPTPSITAVPFRDTDENAFYFEAMLWALEKGITAGISSTEFGPGEPCTRAQAVTFLHRAQNLPAAASSNPFQDVDPDAFCHDAVLWAVENGVTNGLSATVFGPEVPCTRGQIVTFLHRTPEHEMEKRAKP